MIVTTPHRYGLQETSCVNKEIEVFTRKLNKVGEDCRQCKNNTGKLKKEGFHTPWTAHKYFWERKYG